MTHDNYMSTDRYTCSPTDLNTGHSEVRNLKSDVYRRPTLAVIGYDTRQTKVRSHQEVFASREWLDGPDDSVGFWRVLAAAGRRLELGRVRVHWDRHDDLHVVSGRTTLELALCLHQSHMHWRYMSIGTVKSNQIKWRICSVQHTEKTEACCTLQQQNTHR